MDEWMEDVSKLVEGNRDLIPSPPPPFFFLQFKSLISDKISVINSTAVSKGL